MFRVYLIIGSIESRISVTLLLAAIFLACISHIQNSYQDSEVSTNIIPSFSEQGTVFNFDADIGHGRHLIMSLPVNRLIFKPVVSENKAGDIVKSISLNFVEKPEFGSLYHEIGNYNNKEKVVFVYPIFTEAAYGENGFYDFYNKKCGSTCLTVPIPDKIKAIYSSSGKGANVLSLLNYSFITDITIDQNPDILKNYDKVIILHNEYVTQTEFNAITQHPHVVFLYPNALYAKVSVNYDKNAITLLRGHGYPDGIRNGFDWKYDSSKYEYNYDCSNWNFFLRGNYTFLNCYPEYRILYDAELLRTLKEKDPSNLLIDMSNWLTYPIEINYSKILLSDLDINGQRIPSWVATPVLWTINGEINRDEFAVLMIYLNNTKIIQ